MSVASLWEIAIKTRIGKLDLGMSPTSDPFDHMLLAQCSVEGLRLVTVDRALVDHALAWQAT